MRRILTVLLLLSGTGAARAVPVVPNFTQGSMTSHTETTSTVTETINSMDYNTGWQYVVTGTNVESSGNLTPTGANSINATQVTFCLLYTSPSPRDVEESRMPSSA